MTGVHVFQQPLWLRLFAAVLFVGVAVCLAAGGIDTGGWLAVAGPLGGLAVLALALRNWQLRIEAADDVRLVDLLRTRRIPWRDIERFGYDSGLWVRLVDGRQLSPSAFSASPGQLDSATRRGEAAARELERMRRRRC